MPSGRRLWCRRGCWEWPELCLVHAAQFTGFLPLDGVLVFAAAVRGHELDDGIAARSCGRFEHAGEIGDGLAERELVGH